MGVGTRFIASHGVGNPVWEAGWGTETTGRRAWEALTLGSYVAPPPPWDAINRVPTTFSLRSLHGWILGGFWPGQELNTRHTRTLGGFVDIHHDDADIVIATPLKSSLDQGIA